jgi:bifunctional DNA-binding transcriptional regulator/antitoxin component of YhaV-PrlF toxin-antitoxin module
MASRSKQVAFTAPLVAGHEGVTAVIVPFAPAEQWGTAPVPLDDRREGWLVAGSLDEVAFEGWIGQRWGRYFVIVDAALREAAGIAIGDPIEVIVAPTRSATALAIAKAQAPLTTAPKRSLTPERRSAGGGRPARTPRTRPSTPRRARRTPRR